MYFHLRFVLSAMIHYIVSTFSPTNLLSLFIHLTNMLVYFARCTYVFFIFFSCSVPITLVCFCSLYCVGHHFQKGAKCHPQSQFFWCTRKTKNKRQRSTLYINNCEYWTLSAVNGFSITSLRTMYILKKCSHCCDFKWKYPSQINYEIGIILFIHWAMSMLFTIHMDAIFWMPKRVHSGNEWAKTKRVVYNAWKYSELNMKMWLLNSVSKMN